MKKRMRAVLAERAAERPRRRRAAPRGPGPVAEPFAIGRLRARRTASCRRPSPASPTGPSGASRAATAPALAVSEMIASFGIRHAQPQDARDADDRARRAPGRASRSSAPTPTRWPRPRGRSRRPAPTSSTSTWAARCPKICKTGAGAALLADLERRRAASSRRWSRAVDIPVTVKMRRGLTPADARPAETARRLEAAGAAALCVHPRAAAEEYDGHGRPPRHGRGRRRGRRPGDRQRRHRHARRAPAGCSRRHRVRGGRRRARARSATPGPSATSCAAVRRARARLAEVVLTGGRAHSPPTSRMALGDATRLRLHAQVLSLVPGGVRRSRAMTCSGVAHDPDAWTRRWRAARRRGRLRRRLITGGREATFRRRCIRGRSGQGDHIDGPRSDPHRRGYEKLKEEIEYLSTTKRREVAERIKEAREFGDISENSEYDDAKNEQAQLEYRIQSLEQKLRNARVVDTEHVSTDTGVDRRPGDPARTRKSKADPRVLDRRLGRGRPARTSRLSNESPVGQGAARHARRARR